ncbi:hypothetical protein PMIT1323_01179 [Prochlorococcus marinus str. MIT 1323]|nr:hypothetical protein PMIT1323_01179 [Prochlorococcus marinus str. MIT 1323]
MSGQVTLIMKGIFKILLLVAMDLLIFRVRIMLRKQQEMHTVRRLLAIEVFLI